MMSKANFDWGRRSAPPIPDNLLDWTDHEALIKSVSCSVMQENDWQLRSLGFPDRLMAELIVYCYSRGIYASAEVSRLAASHAQIGMIFGLRAEDWSWVCRFRKKHGPLLRASLARLFRKLWENGRQNGGAWAGMNCLHSVQLNTRTAEAEAGVPDFSSEAARRLEQAAFLDCIALDD